jgi:hypothetical protein
MTTNGDNITLFTNPNHLIDAKGDLRRELGLLVLENPEEKIDRLIVTCDKRRSPFARFIRGDWDIIATDVSTYTVWNRGEDATAVDVSFDEPIESRLSARFPTQFPSDLPEKNHQALYMAESNGAEEIPYDIAKAVLAMKRRKALDFIQSREFSQTIETSRTNVS